MDTTTTTTTTQLYVADLAPGSEPASPTEFVPDHADSWSAPGVRPAITVNIWAGLLYGVSIGNLPVMLTFAMYLGDCARYTAPDVCNSLTNTGCAWITPDSSNNVSSAFCGFPDHRTVNCTFFQSQDSCSNAHGGTACYWRFHEKTCAHNAGWDAGQQGMLAGMQIVGSMIAAALSGVMLDRIGRRKSVGVAGLACVMACFFFTVGWAAKENYPMLVLGEVSIGVASGFVSVLSPMYTGELLSKSQKLQQTIGVVFQLMVTFGIFLAAGVGLALDMRNDTGAEHAHLQGRFFALISVQWATAIAAFPIAWWMPESPEWLRHRATGDDGSGSLGLCEESVPLRETKDNSTGTSNIDDERRKLMDHVKRPSSSSSHNNSHNSNSNLNNAQSPAMTGAARDSLAEIAAVKSTGPALIREQQQGLHHTVETVSEEKQQQQQQQQDDSSSQKQGTYADLFTRDHILPLAVGITLAASQQLTGVNSIFAFAPTMASKLGLAPLVGNFLITVWNFLTCIVSVPVAARFPARKVFITTVAISAVACAMTSIAVFPGIFGEESAAHQGIGIAGICLYVMVFEIGIGPLFYVLAQEVFPPRVRSVGAAFTVWACFAFNTFINWGYFPIQTAISGGPSGDQNFGMAVCFAFFAGIGVVCSLFLGLKMPRTNSEVQREQQQKESVRFSS